MRQHLMLGLLFASNVVCGGDHVVVSEAKSTAISVDTAVTTGDVVMVKSQKELLISYSAVQWNDAESDSATVLVTLNGKPLFESCGEGQFVWSPERAGSYCLRHVVNGVSCVKRVQVLAPHVQFARIGENLCGLSSSDGVSMIRYTIDGSVPTPESCLYKEPFVIPMSMMTVVRACTQSDDCVLGEVESVAFETVARCVSSGEGATIFNTQVGAERLNAEGPVDVVWSGLWDGNEDSTSEIAVNGEIVHSDRGEGIWHFYPDSIGTYQLLHDTKSNGVAVGGRLMATIEFGPVLRRGVVCDGVAIIANGTTEIGAIAFANREELVSVTIPMSVRKIGPDAFAGCTKLTKVVFPLGMEVTREKLRGWGLSDAVLDDYVEGDFVIVNKSLLGYVGAADVAELVIPDGIELIDEYALAELYDLERVELPETVRYIGKGAFANDTYLDEVELPDTVEVIGEGAFEDCSWMQKMTMGAGVRSVGDRAFAGCTKLAATKFVEGLGEVGDAAFSNCWRMMSVSLPVSVSNVAATAFKDCESLTGVTVPTMIAPISEWFAPVYRQIENVSVPEGSTEVCAEMFAGCAALKTVELPEGVTNIASGAFRDCVALETILLPESLAAIGDEAFAGCAALKAIVLPKNVAALGKRVFSGCVALSDVTLSPALMAIPDETFAGCAALDSFVVPETVTALGSRIVPSATKAIYYLGNAPTYAADVYAGANPSLVSYVVEGTKGWDGRPMSRDIPQSWPTTNSRAITTWPPIKINVTFVGNGGMFEDSADESCVCKQIVDTGYSLPPYEPVRKGYRFDGYWTEADGGARITSGIAVKLTKDHSLYSHWKECDTPIIEGDERATVIGDAETGFVIRPSEGNTAVKVMIPQGVDAAKVTVEVSPNVVTVKPNGAKVKVAVGEDDITNYLVIPESGGVLNIAAATVKEEIVKEALDPSKDAVIELNAADPQLTTAPTRKGLTYTLYEGRKLESLSKGDSKLGDGNQWTPTIKVLGGDAAFYSIGVSK